MPSERVEGWQREAGSTRMRRPSYLRQLASRAATRAGAAVIVPPRSVFRADGASGFVEANKPYGDEVPDALPRTAATSPRPSRGPPPADLQARAATPHGGRSDTAHAAAIAVREPNARESLPTEHTPASPNSTVGAHSHASRIGVDALTPSAAFARQAAAESKPTLVATPKATPASAPTMPPIRASRNKVVVRGTPASLEQIAEAARIVTPHPTPSAAPYGSANRAPGDPSPLDGGKPSSADSPDIHSAQAGSEARPSLAAATQEAMIRASRVDTMPPSPLIPQPTRPAPPAKPESRATGLHIGTLEVHVASPPSLPPQAHLAPTRAVRRTGGATRRIARGFSVFGLGQS